MSSTALLNSTGRGATRADQAVLVERQASGWSLNFLKVPLNQCGKLVLIRLTDSPILPRLGAVPPQPAWCGMARAMRSSKAAASRAVLPSREWPTTAMRSAVEVLVGDEVIDGPVNAPGPGGDGAPVVRPRLVALLGAGAAGCPRGRRPGPGSMSPL